MCEFVFKEKTRAEATVGSMTDIATGEGLPITSTFDNSIQQKSGNVNRNSRDVFADDRTMYTEETEDLIAVHNLKAEQVIDALTRGQLSMPSIAVTNKQHTKFGEYSVIFDKDTIEPEKNWETSFTVLMRGLLRKLL